LFFYSLISRRKEINKYGIVQGTTYTTLPFLDNGVPVVSHFGSTTFGFLKNVPSEKKLEREKKELSAIFREIKKNLSISERTFSVKSLRDISNIEMHVAKKSNAVIATSAKVKSELVTKGVKKEKIHIIHNAIENYWFRPSPLKRAKRTAGLVYLGRMGDDVFTIKLKGINRLIFVFRNFPLLKKKVIGMCSKIEGYNALFSSFPKLKIVLSAKKKKIPGLLRNNYADILVNPGRYEGFCLSLVEAMSQGLVPVTFPVGIAPEIIRNGENGYIVETIDEMVEKIRYLSQKRKKRAEMADRAMQTARQFNADAMIKQMVSLYKKLKTENSRRRLIH